MRATITVKTARAFRLTRIQVLRSKRSLRKRARRARVVALTRLFRAQQVSARAGRNTLIVGQRRFLHFSFARFSCCSFKTDAADGLACLGISLLELDRIETAQGCAKAIARLATNSAALHPEPFTLADVQKRLEILARAADALGKAQAAASIRALIQKPDTVSDAEWPHYLQARETRLSRLDERLGDWPHRSGTFRDDPVAELQRVLKRSAGDC
jgi:hypothetical protein